MRSTRFLSKTLVGLTLLSCAHAPPAAVTDDPQVVRILGELQSARGASALAPVAVRRLTADEFRDAARHRVDLEHHEAELKKVQELWIAFGFSKPSVDSESVYRKTYDEQLAAFYDRSTKTLMIPSDSNPALAALPADFLLTHEIEHALQDQRFGIDRLLEHAHTHDEFLAINSVLEGDAMLAAVEVQAQKEHRSVPEALARQVKTLRSVPPSQLAGLGGHSPALEAAPTLARDELMSPYLDGLGFFARLELTGGNAMVDQVFAHLPESTRQIADPGSYLRGVHPVVVTAPAPPPGAQVVDQGTLGSLGLRAWLEEHHLLNRSQANGWRGDAYTLAKYADGSLLLLWTVALTNPKAASLLAANVKKLGKGWGEATVSGDHLPPGIAVVHEGATLGLAIGTEDEALARPLLALVQPATPDSPPLGAVTLAALPKLVEDHDAGTVTDGGYQSDALGLSFPLPAGFSALAMPTPSRSSGSFKLELRMRSTAEPRTSGVLMFLPAPYDVGIDTVVTTFGAGLIKNWGKGVTQELTEDIDLGWTHGKVARFDRDGSKVKTQVIFAPLCEGRYIVIFLTVAATDQSAALLEQWPKQVTATSDGTVCAAP